jgi:hypothetical protein
MFQHTLRSSHASDGKPLSRISTSENTPPSVRRLHRIVMRTTMAQPHYK